MEIARVSVALVALLTTAGASCSPSRGSAPFAAREAVAVVACPGARLDSWDAAEGPPGRRFVDACRRRGWILRPADLDAPECRLLDRWDAEGTGDCVRVIDRGGAGSALISLGPPGGEVPLRWSGLPSPRAPERLRFASQSWLHGDDRLRWEEVAEILALTPQENLAFRNLCDPEHPMERLRHALLSARRAAGVAVYLLGTRDPAGLAFSLGLPERFEGEVAPFMRRALESTPVPDTLPAAVDGAPAAAAPRAPSLSAAPEGVRMAAARRFFAWRVLASSARIYGRCDRICQSLAAESARGALIVVDARRSADPFVAVLENGGSLPPARDRGALLERRLACPLEIASEP